MCFGLVAMLGRDLVVSLGLHSRALLDQEEKATVDQRVQEVATQLVALAISTQALCDIMLDDG